VRIVTTPFSFEGKEDNFSGQEKIM